MTTLYYQRYPEPTFQIGSLFHAVLPKTFLYLCPVPRCRKTYTKAVWYCKHLAKKHTDLCEVEPYVCVMLNDVTNAAIAVWSNYGPQDFEEYDDSEEDNHQSTADLLEMFKELGFVKLLDVCHNPELISPSLPNNLIQTQ